MNILISEDDLHIQKVVKTYFVKEVFNIFVAEDGKEALQIVKC